MPGGFAVQLVAYVVAAGLGALLAGWGSRKSKQENANK
jgi:sugar phosphate permease